VVRADTADALRRAAFKLVELTDDCWREPRGVGSWTPTDPEYEEQVGPSSSIRLQFGQISDADPWISIATTWPGEYGRRDAGNGFVQVFTFDQPPEEKARSALSNAAALSNAVRRLKHGVEPTPFLSDEESEAIKRVAVTMEALPLDGERVCFCVVRAFDVTAASANFVDRGVTVMGRFDATNIRLQTVKDPSRYLR
jgi:hypothetical protein